MCIEGFTGGLMYVSQTNQIEASMNKKITLAWIVCLCLDMSVYCLLHVLSLLSETVNKP